MPMNLAFNREKLYGYAFFALYGLAMIVVSVRHLTFALLALAASAVCVCKTIPSDAEDREHQRKQIYLFLVVSMVPALYVIWDVHHQEWDARRFKTYLSEHRCAYQGNVITGLTRGGCDRLGNCEELQEIEDAEFLCAATGSHITYTDFKAGNY